MATESAARTEPHAEPVDLIKVDTALNSLRASNFDTPAAVGEPVDNAIQAGANRVRICLSQTRRKMKKKEVAVVDEIAIGDDGSGMSEEVLHRSLVLGYSTRYDDRRGIGRFGVGATLAGISQARRIDIFSRSVAEAPYLHTYIDLDEIASGRQKHIPKPEAAELPERYRELVGKGTGTLVIWSKCDRISEGENGTVADIAEVKAEIVNWLARAYRSFLDSGIKIEVDDKPILPHDPLYLMTSRFPDDAKAELLFSDCFDWPVPSDSSRTSKVCVRMTLLPDAWRKERGWGDNAFARERRIDENEGLSIMRANREIFFGIIPKFYKYGVQPIDRWIGIEIAFDPELDECFHVRNVKRGAEPVAALRDKLRNMIQQPMLTARERIRKHYIAVENEKKAAESLHEGAEHVAAEADKTAPKPRAGVDVTPEERKERIRKHAEKSDRQVEQLTEQPFSIVDDQWPGKDFIEIEHLGPNTIIKLNNRHPFFTEVYSKVVAATKRLGEAETVPMSADDVVSLARVVHTGLDLLLIAYAKAEGQHPTPTEHYGDLRTQWGLFLHNMVQKMGARS